MSAPRAVHRVVLLVAVLVASAGVAAEPVSFDGEHDIGALLAAAETAFPSDRTDAVLLLDSLSETWTADGRRVSSVHQIVLLRSRWAIDHFADLRVPFDAAHQSMAVHALRTWRLSDRRWTAGGPTAQVETLPFALERAADYTNLREMMLLHDGIELPCVLETAYTITDSEPYRPGLDGLWTFARSAPCMQARFVLATPIGSEPVVHASSRVPAPVIGSDPASGLETRTFAMGPLEPLPEPVTVESLGHVPRVAWSTWSSWEELGRELAARFERSAAVDEALEARLAESLEGCHTGAERARRVAALVSDTTRAVDYDDSWWPEPRPAPRTYASGYGHRLDRTVLAIALFRAAGLGADPVFLGDGYGGADDGVPTLARLGRLALEVSGTEFDGHYDAESGSFAKGDGLLCGRAVWRPGKGGPPRVETCVVASHLKLYVDLEYGAEDALWHGRGVLKATDGLSPYGRMAGLEDEALDVLGALSGALFDGAEVTGWNPEVFQGNTVVAGFAFALPVGDRDRLGRLRLELGDPTTVLGDPLGHGLDPSRPTRTSAVHLPDSLDIGLELRLLHGDLALVRLPEPRVVDNQAGAMTVEVERCDGEITLSRRLRLDHAHYAPEQWPDLRALLLAYDHEQGRTLLLE
jgi:hypothetical protein